MRGDLSRAVERDLDRYARFAFRELAQHEDPAFDAESVAIAVGAYAARLGLSLRGLKRWLQGAYGSVWVRSGGGGLVPGLDLKDVWKAIERSYRAKMRRTGGVVVEHRVRRGRLLTEARLGARKHLLLTKALRRKLPKLYSQEKVRDPMVYVRFFSPYSNAVWLVTEFDGDDTLFGWADMGHGGGELGYFSLRELERASRRGLPMVERDKYFKPMPLSRAKLA